MSNAIVITDKRSAAIEPAPAMNPMQELQMQIVRTGDLEKLKQLREIEKEWREDQAKQAFNQAMSRFKATPLTIRKNKHVGFESKREGVAKTDYWHATLDNVCASICPALAECGLRYGWDVKEAQNQITVTCTITHSLGHSESVSMSGPLDATGNKNVIQQKGSTVTYLERYTLLAITGLAATDQDDDGGRTVSGKPESPGEVMEGAAVDDFKSMIEGSGDHDELQRNYFAARDAAAKAKDLKATETFANAKNKRLFQLNKQTGVR